MSTAKYKAADGTWKDFGGGGSTAWVRPADWLLLPDANNSFKGLMAVWDSDGNYVAIQAWDDFTVDWGDGTAPQNYTGGALAEHKFNYADLPPETTTTRGYRQAIVTVTPQSGRTFNAFWLNQKHSRYYGSATPTGWLDVSIDGPALSVIRLAKDTNGNGGVEHRMLERVQIKRHAQTNMPYMFNSLYALREVPLFDTSNVTNMAAWFNFCYALREVPMFDTGKVTNMSQMFYSCSALREVPLFNTSKVTNMQYMFNGCSMLREVPLFNTTNVTNMSYMFNSCKSLETVPLFDTTNVTNMSYMFASCSALQSVPLFNTGKVTNMTYMFSTCTVLHTIPMFNTAAVTNMSYMFEYSGITVVPGITGAGVTSAAGFNSIVNACYGLISFQVIGAKFSLNIGWCQLEASELNRVYTNLAAGVTGQTITVSSNPGVDADDPTIATAKGWTVTGS